jgi:hypothetical protein
LTAAQTANCAILQHSHLHVDPHSGPILGICLSSLEAHGIHITQVCVAKAARKRAIDIYERIGFTKRADFWAYVWDGF